MSLMCQMIDDLLAEATRAGVVPQTIRLGAVQMRVFEQWAAQTSAAAPGSEYDGLPVVPDMRDSYCGVTGTDGEELSLP